MAFFKVIVTHNFSLFEATAESGCVVGGESVVCEVVNFVVLLKRWKQGRCEIFGLCLQTSALSSHPI
jgi:hypothetical protein